MIRIHLSFPPIGVQKVSSSKYKCGCNSVESGCNYLLWLHTVTWRARGLWKHHVMVQLERIDYAFHIFLREIKKKKVPGKKVPISSTVWF